MSFRCGFCEKVQPRGTKPKKVVTKIRWVVNPEQVTIKNGGRVGYIGGGREIVEEKMACPSCAESFGGPEVIEEEARK